MIRDGQPPISPTVPSTGGNNIPRNANISTRADELFDAQLHKLHCQTDRIFLVLMVLQWLAAIVVACWVSPYSWSGTERYIHYHVWTALILGGAISSLPTLLVIFSPGQFITRLSIAIAQMLWSALLVHLTGGRIETHFHVFVSLAFLAFYRDYSLIVVATVVTALDHFLRGIFWPYSVYGVLTSTPWRSVEHAAWVVFEDVGLMTSIGFGLQNFRSLSSQQAMLEQAYSLVETQVQERTLELQQKAESLESAESMLRMNRDRLDFATRGTSDGLWDRNLLTNEIWVSDRYLELLGYKPNELAFTVNEFFRRLHDEDLQRTTQAIEKHLSDGVPFDVEYRMQLKDGDYRWFRCRGKCIRDTKGKAHRIAGAMQDISEQKRSDSLHVQQEERLRQKQKLEAVGELAGGIAHEFNNLLQIIQGFARFARNRLDDAESSATDLDQVIFASERATILTRQLLNFSRSDQLALASVHIKELLTSSILTLKPIIRENIKIKLAVADALPHVQADPNGMHQVLMNLCLNAQDAMPDGGELTISADRQEFAEQDFTDESATQRGEYISISVADSGIGMSPELIQRIFEPFFTTKDIGKGTGLGLAVVHGIIQQFKGSVRVESTVGVGTTFQIILPIAIGELEKEKAVEPESLGGKETILLAEDDPMIRRFTTRVLESGGYKVLSAINGEEAVSMYRQHRHQISLLVFDVVMPKMTGREAYEQIQSFDPNVNVVFCSGYDPNLVKKTRLGKSDAPFVEKPYQPGHLLNVVRETLDAAFPVAELA